MKKLLTISLVVFITACNNEQKPITGQMTTPSENNQTENTTTAVPDNNNVSEQNANTKFTMDDKEIGVGGSLLVQKDKDKLKPGNDYMVMLTAMGGPNNESRP